jgi:hypothetical protein
MKTTEKYTLSKAQTEVWEWKEKAYQEIKDMTFEQKKAYFEQVVLEAAKILNTHIEKNEKGTLTFGL